jgi:hypothetical protein
MAAKCQKGGSHATPAVARDEEARERPCLQPLPYRYRNLVERFFNKLKHFNPLREARHQLPRARQARRNADLGV